MGEYVTDGARTRNFSRDMAVL